VPSGPAAEDGEAYEHKRVDLPPRQKQTNKQTDTKPRTRARDTAMWRNWRRCGRRRTETQRRGETKGFRAGTRFDAYLFRGGAAGGRVGGSEWSGRTTVSVTTDALVRARPSRSARSPKWRIGPSTATCREKHVVATHRRGKGRRGQGPDHIGDAPCNGQRGNGPTVSLGILLRAAARCRCAAARTEGAVNISLWRTTASVGARVGACRARRYWRHWRQWAGRRREPLTTGEDAGRR
jgi:hypothetical protein